MLRKCGSQQATDMAAGAGSRKQRAESKQGTLEAVKDLYSQSLLLVTSSSTGAAYAS